MHLCLRLLTAQVLQLCTLRCYTFTICIAGRSQPGMCCVLLAPTCRARCRDLIDLLLGWALEPALPDAARQACMQGAGGGETRQPAAAGID